MTAQNLQKSSQNNTRVDMQEQKDNNLEEEKFRFTEQNREETKKILARYPEDKKQSAVLPLMTMAQTQNGGWLSKGAIEYVAELLDMTYIQAYEVATFYSMFNLSPVGKCHLQICGTTPCWLKGAEEVKQEFLNELNVSEGQVTGDEMFSVSEVECLGACVNGPVLQVNNEEYHEDLTPEKVKQVLSKLRTEKGT